MDGTQWISGQKSANIQRTPALFPARHSAAYRPLATKFFPGYTAGAWHQSAAQRANHALAAGSRMVPTEYRGTQHTPPWYGTETAQFRSVSGTARSDFGKQLSTDGGGGVAAGYTVPCFICVECSSVSSVECGAVSGADRRGPVAAAAATAAAAGRLVSAVTGGGQAAAWYSLQNPEVQPKVCSKSPAPRKPQPLPAVK